jgi:hypothetical protein
VLQNGTLLKKNDASSAARVFALQKGVAEQGVSKPTGFETILNPNGEAGLRVPKVRLKKKTCPSGRRCRFALSDKLGVS